MIRCILFVVCFCICQPIESFGLSLSPEDASKLNPVHSCNDSSVWSRQLYHKASQKCYEMGTQGPCPNNLAIFQIPFADIYGDCDCPQKEDGNESPFPNVYHPKTDQCYPAYTQAYCGEANWLTFTDTTTVKCTENPCVNGTIVNPVFVEGQCTSLGSLCGPTEEGNFIGFHSGDVMPTCGGGGGFASVAKLSVGTIKCGKGQVLDAQGECRDLVIFD